MILCDQQVYHQDSLRVLQQDFAETASDMRVQALTAADIAGGQVVGEW